jgi:hypothetical protein
METHHRGQAHSAVAGAAYRLGLKLYDRRLKRAFDFRKRDAGNEILFQTTLAPPGSPDWATDPLELWNRVEQAERRKDAQIARDYRVPLPLGLSDFDVCAMAVEIARYISKKLTTPVSVAVHRDTPVTAFGEAKSEAQRGCHAHLYFPTRKILLEEAAAEDGKSGGSGMGEKLSFLSNKSTAGFFVDDLNKLWAEVANRFTSAAGLTPDYDHRSYRRMGLAIRPQPRLGEAVTAMERAGHQTRRGAQVLEARAMSEVYRRVHPGGAGQRRAPFSRIGATPIASFVTAIAPDDNAIHFTPGETKSVRQADPSSQRPSAPLSLTERFRELYFVGMEEGDRPEQTLVFRLVMLIERTLARLRRVGSEQMDLDKEKKQAQTERLDAQADLAEWQASKRSAESEASSTTSVWQRVAEGVESWMNPADPIEVKRHAAAEDETEQRLEARVATKALKVKDLVEQLKPLKREGTEHLSVFRKALHDLDALHEAALPQLLAVSWEDERQWIERYMPDLLNPAPEAGEGRRGRGQLAPAFELPRKPRGGQ